MIQGTIPHYRVPVFDELGKRVDLTIVFSTGKAPEGVSFKCIQIPTFNLRYTMHKRNLYSMAKYFDVVICMCDPGYLYMRLLGILPHNYKLIYWGIGVSASYDSRFDEDQLYAKKILKYISKADAMLFYSEYPIEKYSKLGVPKEKLFAANNTVLVLDSKESEKGSILFIGSLYKQKKIDILLEAYLRAYNTDKNVLDLVIVGDGDERQSVEDWIAHNSLAHKIELTGGIYEESKLVPLFEKALICVSPDQAGLSVLKSMGYGVPYVTHKNAITGGEIFNIKDGENGILMDDFDELEEIILDTAANPDKYRRMGVNGKMYYNENRTVDNMVGGFCDAIEYVMRNVNE